MKHIASVDKLMNPEDTVLHELLFGTQSELCVQVGKTGFLNDTNTSTDQIELSTTSSPKDFSGTNTSEKFETFDMSFDANNHQGNLNDGSCDSSRGVPSNSLQTHVERPSRDSASSFCNDQSKYASSNGLMHLMLNTAVSI